jgi:anthranilate 1,2-dioxygenase small subunit
LSADIVLRLAIEDLYADYAEALDDGKITRWPTFFAEPCLYRLVSKENHDKGLPLSLMLCNSQGMLRDRALACQEFNVYAPRTWRHLITQIRIRGADETMAGPITVRANFAILETLQDQHTAILCAGRYRDQLVWVDGALRFREKVCIYDTNLIPGTVVFPV